MKINKFRFSPLMLLFFSSLFVFSSALMWKTFRLRDGTIEMAAKVWSDFGATIPLERSFAYGWNFPPQYPIFAGPPIRYHFIFYMLVGFMERIGIPLDWALNSLSILGFFLLLVLIYFLAYKVFESKFVGVVSVLLFLFNGSWGFLEFFNKHPFSPTILHEIITNNTFSSFGPYDRKIVSAFWSLNIFTNQRHLALGYAALLALLYKLYTANKNAISIVSLGKSKGLKQLGESLSRIIISLSENGMSYLTALYLGIGIGFFPFIHLSVYMMMGIALLISFFVFEKIRGQIIVIAAIAGSIGIPQILLMGQSTREVQLFHPGYLVEHLNTIEFLKYWAFNLGLLVVVAPIGFFLAKRRQRKIFLPFLTFFIVGNIFQFSPEIASNHKFFNIFVIGANMFSAYALYRLWRLNISAKVAVVILLIPLTLTGIIDIFPIFNDGMMSIKDIPQNKTAKFILENTSADSVFLNASFIDDPASLAGRKIYLGWPYFAWSAGYDTDTRFKTMKNILAARDKKDVCKILSTENIDYIETQEPTPIEEAVINYQFFDENFKSVYNNPELHLKIYDVNATCSGTLSSIH